MGRITTHPTHYARKKSAAKPASGRVRSALTFSEEDDRHARRDPAMMNPANKAIGTTQATSAGSRGPLAAQTPSGQTRPTTTNTGAYGGGGGAPSPSCGAGGSYGGGGYAGGQFPNYTNSGSPVQGYYAPEQMEHGDSNIARSGSPRMNAAGHIPGSSGAQTCRSAFQFADWIDYSKCSEYATDSARDYFQHDIIDFMTDDFQDLLIETHQSNSDCHYRRGNLEIIQKQSKLIYIVHAST
ncbi:hypothetical protein HDV00_000371 [Rhizophlyctis rosea]|nr:hypothetical protein HDV00_000371 [Rhizophlyctis rosea]